jgi:hypothetical protein
MTLDTGSPTNWLVDSSFKAIRAHCVEPSDPTALEQEEAKEAAATLWACSPMTVGHIPYNAARFTVASIHGYVLGYPFLHAYGKVGLNIRTQQLFFY